MPFKTRFFIISFLIVLVLSNLSVYVKNENISKILLPLCIELTFLFCVVYSDLPD